MTYNDLRRSIYESYQSGEISAPQATQMLEKVMDIEGDHIVAEYEALENTFMGVAMEAANGYMDFTDFQEQAQVYTEGVKEIWNKFLDWVKGIISAIFGIEFKGNPMIEVNNDKVSLYQKFTAYCKKITSGNADGGLITGFVGLAAAAGAAIFGGHKVKMRYKKFAEIQDTAAKAGQDVVEWMTDPKNEDNELLKQIGARGQATLKRVLDAIENDKKGVVGLIYKHIGKKSNITKEKLEELKKNHKADDTANGDVVTKEDDDEENTVAATAAVTPVATHAGTDADGTYSDVNKNKKKYKDMFGKNPPDDATAEQIATALQTKVALERKKIDTTGDVFAESSSWDDIFAYMDI